jgi:hypothetical protein
MKKTVSLLTSLLLITSAYASEWGNKFPKPPVSQLIECAENVIVSEKQAQREQNTPSPLFQKHRNSFSALLRKIPANDRYQIKDLTYFETLVDSNNLAENFDSTDHDSDDSTQSDRRVLSPFLNPKTGSPKKKKKKQRSKSVIAAIAENIAQVEERSKSTPC